MKNINAFLVALLLTGILGLSAAPVMADDFSNDITSSDELYDYPSGSDE